MAGGRDFAGEASTEEGDGTADVVSLTVPVRWAEPGDDRSTTPGLAGEYVSTAATPARVPAETRIARFISASDHRERLVMEPFLRHAEPASGLEHGLREGVRAADVHV